MEELYIKMTTGSNDFLCHSVVDLGNLSVTDCAPVTGQHVTEWVGVIVQNWFPNLSSKEEVDIKCVTVFVP